MNKTKIDANTKEKNGTLINPIEIQKFPYSHQKNNSTN